MPDLKPVLFVNGLVLLGLAAAMLVPVQVDLSYGRSEWTVFAGTAALTCFVGVCLTLVSRSRRPQLKLRQAFVLTTTVWIVIAAFSALPFHLSSLNLSLTDSFFEAVSGITTTGSTVIVALETVSPGILIWRAMLQWLGGIGVIVTAISILPMLRVGGMQLFKVEAFEADKVLPRAKQIALEILFAYALISAVAALTYYLLGMSGFDAVAHAMTTVATAGYSTRDASFAAFNSASLEWAASLFMILGSIPFVLYLRALHGSLRPLFRDQQVRGMLLIMAIEILSLTLWLLLQLDMPFMEGLRHATFNAISIMTGTGFASAPFDQWGDFALGIFFLLMFIGGCAGSTSCGIKVFRFQILYETAKTQLRRLMQPSGVFLTYYNGRPVTEQIAGSVMSFFFLFLFFFSMLSVLLGALGLDFLTSISAAASAMANVGPGLGPVVGPGGSFASLPDAAKWLLAAGMLLGRLEIFTVLVLFMPSFWRG